MLKYLDTQVTLREVPDEITLCINLTRCPCKCIGCHSSYLAEDTGKVLTISRLEKLIHENKGISAICFMGGDNDPKLINHYAYRLHISSINIKIGWYSGRQELSEYIDLRNFDYIKLGPYKEECGPLDSKTTNQRFYKVVNTGLVDITSKFWKNED